MNSENLISIIQNLGVPVGILAYVLWRGDFFMRYFIHKLDKFNDELNAINLTLRDIHNQLKK